MIAVIYDPNDASCTGLHGSGSSRTDIRFDNRRLATGPLAAPSASSSTAALDIRRGIPHPVAATLLPVARGLCRECTNSKYGERLKIKVSHELYHTQIKNDKLLFVSRTLQEFAIVKDYIVTRTTIANWSNWRIMISIQFYYGF